MLKDKSKDKDNTFIVIFSCSKTKRVIEKEGMTYWCWPWNVINIQHITTNSKRSDYSDIPDGTWKD